MSGGITIRIIKTGRGQVRLGIEAPREIEIYRAEVIDRINKAIAETEREELNA